MTEAPLTLGIEEEYQIIDPETRKLSAYVQQMMNEGSTILGEQVKPEFMQSQIEVGSNICRNVQEARQELVRLRREIARVAANNGRVIAAASTHPFSRWDEQQINEGARYKNLETSMQDVGRRMLIFGMHVHVGFGTDTRAFESMIDIQNQLRYFLPHILVLTTSSPFWLGRDTGLKSYRSIVFENLPRTGIPPIFDSWHDYQHFVGIFGRVGALGKERPGGKADYTKLWWDTRPQEDFGTLEVRVCDVCTTIDEAICIAALIQALVAKLLKLRNQNQSWRIYRSELIAENKWRAVRGGLDGKLVDYGREEAIPARFLAKELLDFVDDVLDDLNSRKEAEYLNTMLEQGTSSDRQLAVFRDMMRDGATREEALAGVVDHLVRETVRDCGVELKPPPPYSA
ncbi:MAG: carboxylate-amine ligase [Aggregatilineales bacterium]